MLSFTPLYHKRLHGFEKKETSVRKIKKGWPEGQPFIVDGKAVIS
jgi:hypothetical protein